MTPASARAWAFVGLGEGSARTGCLRFARGFYILLYAIKLGAQVAS